jgi:geranylgeranyl transferase type-2 subunit alpha
MPGIVRIVQLLDYPRLSFSGVHAWNYRRYILANTPKVRSPKAELTYTKQKILSNFSNFSAWHQRSKVLSSLWENGKLNESKSKENGTFGQFQETYVPHNSAEFELIRDAMYTDPSDQSVWMYHRWLVGNGVVPSYAGGHCHNLLLTESAYEILKREIVAIHELLKEEPDSKCRLPYFVDERYH